MGAYTGLKGGKETAERINRNRKTRAAAREAARENNLFNQPGTGNQ
jgi:hypothetical protein